MTTANALLTAALAYAEHGVLVHPCRPGRKEPILDAWQKLASLDPSIITSWWSSRSNANIGIACGGPARLLVVDIDPDKNGEASFAQLEAEHGALPETVESITPSGGRHLYFLVPAGRPVPGNSGGKLGPGIDTRGQGGHVVAPPSFVGGRHYTWSVDCADTFAEAPAWLLDVLGAASGPQAATPPEEWLALVTEGVTEGARNTAVAKLAGLLFRYLPDPLLAAELVACWNTTRCRPRLPAAELKRTLDSIAALEMKRRGLQ
jgi:Bifunctional DNA primase/polymerase, N-terminal/Primase C terminal 1 (PriCT-1)